MLACLLCGICGCLCYGIGDWLIMYGETSHQGKLFWLTEGVTNIPAWRNNVAMILAFPGKLFCRKKRRSSMCWFSMWF